MNQSSGHRVHLPALWAADTTSDRDRKRLLRTLIADITLLPEPDRTKLRIGIRWHSGAADELTGARPGRVYEQRQPMPVARRTSARFPEVSAAIRRPP